MKDSKTNNTDLISYISTNNLKQMEVALQHYKANTISKSGNTLLHMALSNASCTFAMFKLILDKCDIVINNTNNKGQTALYLALFEFKGAEKQDICNYLLNHNNLVDLAGSSPFNALQKAVATGDVDSAQILLNKQPKIKEQLNKKLEAQKIAEALEEKKRLDEELKMQTKATMAKIPGTKEQPKSPSDKGTIDFDKLSFEDSPYSEINKSKPHSGDTSPKSAAGHVIIDNYFNEGDNLQTNTTHFKPEPLPEKLTEPDHYHGFEHIVDASQPPVANQNTQSGYFSTFINKVSFGYIGK
jgi:hypothetical protein